VIGAVRRAPPCPLRNAACGRRTLGTTVLVSLLLLASGGCSRKASATRDLLHELQHAAVVEETRFLDIGSSAARPFLGAGWSVDETVPPAFALSGDTSFVWAVGESSELVFFVVDPRPMRLLLGLRPFSYPNAPPLGLGLSVNGHALAPVSLPEGDHLVPVNLEAAALVPGENRLRLSSDRAPVAATVLKGSGEQRRLTVAVFFVALGEPSLDLPAFASAQLGRATRAAASGASGPQPTPLMDGPLALHAPAQAVWQLRARDRTSLDYALELTSEAPAEVTLEWLTQGEAEELGRWSLSGTLLGSRTASGSIALPASAGSLRVRAHCAVEGTCSVLLRTLRLDFPPPPRHLHVVWITLDTFRADHLGSYGNPEIHTPNLDRLAREGALFSDAYSHIPITGPAHTSLFTGRYPITHGVRNNGQPQPLSEETFAEYLKAYGWETGAVVSLVVMHSNLHFNQGFDRYSDCTDAPWWRTAPEVTDEALDLLDRQWPERPFFLWAHYSDPHEPYTPPGSTGATVALDLEGEPLASYDSGSGRLLNKRIELRPGPNRLRFTLVPRGSHPSQGVLFRYIGFDSPLVTYRYAEGFSGPNANDLYRLDSTGAVEVDLAGATPLAVNFSMWAIEEISVAESRERYAQEAELVDQEVGRLLQALHDRDLAGQTLVVVSSDHGEGLWDHGQPGHVEQLYQEAVHSPVVFHLPDTIAPQIRDVPAQHIDVLPTLLELLGLPPKPDAQGQSLASLITRPDGSAIAPPNPKLDHRPIFLQTFRPEATAERRALVLDGWKLIYSETTGRRQLYRLPSDPGERHDLSAERPDLVQAMEERLVSLEKANTGAIAPEKPASALDEERLKALGYVH
jgi:arylsulfatase A-like enzyme